MRILGISCLNHDATISVIEDGEIKFAAHSERYSKIKFDEYLNDEIVNEALSYGNPDKIAYFERPYLKKSRQLYAGQYGEVFQLKNTPRNYLKPWFGNQKIHYVSHHLSHAAAGYRTSPYNEACVVVIDSIGEWDTVTIWYAKEGKLHKRYSKKYPHSLGLFYSAMTQRLDLKPQEDEYILMGMDAWGRRNEVIKDKIKADFFCGGSSLDFKNNLHRGCKSWNPHCYLDDGTDQWKFDIAANTQWATEEMIFNIMRIAQSVVPETKDLVYMGGVALNCVANQKISNMWNSLWIMPNPGDGGSSLGCAAEIWGEKINWVHPFLGTDIKGEYPVERAVDAIMAGEVVGIASGRAEFGPRALGNRSLIADPRGDHVKDKMNIIKKRQMFRPFAPSVLEEHARDIFDMPIKNAPYMQFTAQCKYPEKYPAICHIDNSSRVQTVNPIDNKGYYDMIKLFYEKTGCPMVVNTSLNIKGQPIVNDEKDADVFSDHYGVSVLY
jgi:carbamoyltransferase